VIWLSCVCPAPALVFTGDALLIRGCGLQSLETLACRASFDPRHTCSPPQLAPSLPSPLPHHSRTPRRRNACAAYAYTSAIFENFAGWHQAIDHQRTKEMRCSMKRSPCVRAASSRTQPQRAVTSGTAILPTLRPIDLRLLARQRRGAKVDSRRGFGRTSATH
jgi:hypothetical protein